MARKVGKRRGGKAMMFAVTAVGAVFVALPTAILFFIGMVPSLAAFIVDTTPGRYLTRCVIGLNLAGLAPFMHHLWMKDHSISTAMKIVTDIYAWFAIYGASALGWLLFLGLPGAVAMYRTLNARRRIYMLREKQKQLINEWGESILPASELKEKAPEEDENGNRNDKAAAALDSALRAERAAN